MDIYSFMPDSTDPLTEEDDVIFISSLEDDRRSQDSCLLREFLQQRHLGGEGNLLKHFLRFYFDNLKIYRHLRKINNILKESKQNKEV